MEKRFVHFDVMIVAHEQPSVVSKPGEGSFDLVALAIAAEFPPIVKRGFFASAPMRADQEDAPFQQAPAEWIAVVGFVGYHAQRTFARPAPSAARHRNL